MSDRIIPGSIRQLSTDSDDRRDRLRELGMRVPRAAPTTASDSKAAFDRGYATALSFVHAALDATFCEGMSAEDELAVRRQQIERVLAICRKGSDGR